LGVRQTLTSSTIVLAVQASIDRPKGVSLFEVIVNNFMDMAKLQQNYYHNPVVWK
jgi:hypothetical protein